MHMNSSLGDQYASRALALLNDNITVTLVYTIDKYLPKWVLNGEKTSKILIFSKHFSKSWFIKFTGSN